MFRIELREKGRQLREEAERYRRSAFNTSETELRHSYMQLAECYEALASECDILAPPPLPGAVGAFGSHRSFHGSVAGPLG